MTAKAQRPREFTGKHMLAVILAFFGVILAVNLTLATLANTSWTGLVVENTYVASQQFNKKAEEGRAQAALGWTSKLTIAWGEVRYSLTEKAIQLVPMLAVMGAWGRRHMPVTRELAVRAELLEDGGPELWSRLMDDLRVQHLDAPSPPEGLTAFRQLREAYEAACAADKK